MKTVDLLQGVGSLRRVLTRSDADQYIRFVVKYWMFDRIKHHIEHIRLGINDVVRYRPAPSPPAPLHHPFFSTPIYPFRSEVKMCLMICPRYLWSSSTCSIAQSCRLYSRAPKQPSMWSMFLMLLLHVTNFIISSDWRSHASYHGFIGVDDPLISMFGSIFWSYSSFCVFNSCSGSGKLWRISLLSSAASCCTT